MYKYLTRLFSLLLATGACLSLWAQSNKPNGATKVGSATTTIATKPTAYSSSVKINYVRSRQAVAPITDPSTFDAADNTQVKESIQYIDGLGRPIQTVSKQASPNGKDLVAPVVYDAFGREQYKYLPYADESTNYGNFKLDPFNDQVSFITNQNQYPGESIFYGHTIYEASPFNRPLKSFAPGNSWAGSEGGTSEHATTFQYLVNDASDDVKIWNVGNTDATCITDAQMDANNIPAVTGTYDAGQLFKNSTTDEHGKSVVEFKDKDGHVVLKKVQIDDTPAGAYTGWLCTYYVYDDYGLLRFVIPPKAVQLLSANSWDFSSTPLQGAGGELCFRYEYDARNRMIAKKVPGAGWVYMVYDLRDRLTYTQDANMRINTQWMCSLYDNFNRPITTGMINYSGCRHDLQTSLNTAFYNQESKDITASFSAHPTVVVNNRVTGATTYKAKEEIDFVAGFTSEDGANFETILGSAASTTQTILTSPFNPIPTNSVFTALTITYYDDYTQQESDKAYATASNSKLDDGGNSYPESLPTTQSSMTKAMVTGTKVRVLEDPADLSKGQWLGTVTYYDNKGRAIQVQSDNYKGGIDVTTSRYDFSGKAITIYQAHNNPAAQLTTTIKTNMLFDEGGRLKNIKKTINDDANTTRTIAANTYDELGQLTTKAIGQKSATDNTALETLDYTYNIRGWLQGINRDYSRSSTPPSGGGGAGDWGHWFGMELNYDWGTGNNQYNGNIAAQQWKTAGSGEQRAYGYGYDNANRLLYADFNQYTASNWDKSSGINFTVKMGDGQHYNTAYDANGNILQMQQMGLKVNTSTPIDNLYYQYTANSNKLLNVIDLNNDATTTLGDFRTSSNSTNYGTKSSITTPSAYQSYLTTSTSPLVDYTYDNNGNLTSDLNKDITTSNGGAIIYNHLNLPYKITVSSPLGTGVKGTITYIYDAAGNKLEKRVVDNTAPSGVGVNTITTYIGSFVYQQVNTATPTLQFFGHEEGRFRPVSTPTSGGWGADYFIKDHLGNTRMVLTDEQKQFTYPAATLEDGAIATEGTYYSINTSNIASNPPTLPNTYQNNNGNPPYNNNPSSDKTATSQKMYELSGSGDKTGLAITLRVMAGDNVSILGKSFWHLNSAQTISNNNNIVDGLTDFITAFASSPAVTASAHGSNMVSALNSSTPTTGGVTNWLDNVPSPPNKPKAFINWILFDEQFIPVTSGSGFDPVDVADQIKNHNQNVEIIKNGYLYIYCSNESNIPVFFDNLQVVHNHSPLLEETHYYPFGLTMAGISSKAAGEMENKYKYNGKELQYNEFSDGSGLELYDYGARMYDGQVGRFFTQDRFAEKYVVVTPYQYGGLSPVMFNDINGDSLMLFKNGRYVCTADNGKNEITGFNQESKINKGGKEEFTGGQSFGFNDIELDKAELESKKMTLNFMSQREVENKMDNSGVKDQNVFSRWIYAATESNINSGRGNGHMDFLSDVPGRKLTIINGTGYNQHDAGNYLWGYAMGLMGYTSIMARTAAHINAWWSAKLSNPGMESNNINPVLRWIENRSWTGDASADQRAIQNGLNDSESYWKSKKKSFSNLLK